MSNLAERIILLKKIVQEAGLVIVGQNLQKLVNIKDSFTNIITQGDLASEKIIVDQIKKHFPTDKILSEETAEEANVRHTQDFLWVIDPIDGSYNYGKGRKYSAVCVAITQNKQILAGAVFNPFLNDFFFAELGKGATLNDIPIHASQIAKIGQAAFVTDTFNNPEGIRRNVNILFQAQDLAKLIINGSAALGICEVACARADVYMHTRLSPWDVAAAFIVATEAGAVTTNLKGEKIDIYSPEVLVTNPLLLPKCVEVFHHSSGI